MRSTAWRVTLKAYEPLATTSGRQSKEHRLVHDPSVPQVLNDDPLEQRRRHVAVPNPFRVHDDDGSPSTHTEARRLTALDSPRPEQQSFPLKERREQTIQLTTPLIGRTVPAHTHEDVARICIHQRRDCADCHKIVY